MTCEDVEVPEAPPAPFVRLEPTTLFVHAWQSDGADGVAFPIGNRYHPLTFPSGPLCVTLFTGPQRRCACGVVTVCLADV